MNYRTEVFLTGSLTLVHLHTTINPPELVTFNRLEIVFIKSISGVVLKVLV